MNRKERIRISKRLSLVLRHRPDKIGLTLDQSGWVRIADLLEAFRKSGMRLTREDLQYVVDHCDKQRFTISEDGQRIRASQGHSIDVELGYEPVAPPAVLFHGTAEKNLGAILEKGIVKRRRHHVHLSQDFATAVRVGQRHGKPVVLQINASEMRIDGFLFFCSENGVWLVEHVPPRYITVAQEHEE